MSPARLVTLAVAGAIGVAFYVASWALAGTWWDGYDPNRQAISELFAIGAPAPGRPLLVVALVVTGILLVAFGAVLHVGLPGRGLGAPVASAVSGVMTVAIVVVPCTAGCPGASTSTTDLGHAVVATAGYAALVAAPLFAARRVRRHAPGLFWWSLVLGGIAAGGFVARTLGLLPDAGGLQQRVFNTVADAWYVGAAGWIAVRARHRTPPR